MIIFKEYKKLPLIWYSVIKGKLNLNREIWMGVDIDKIGGMATSVQNYYKITLSPSVRIFDFKNSSLIDKLVDKIMPTINSVETLGEWAYFNDISIPIPMNKIFDAIESGDVLVYNAPNIQKAIKNIGFDGLTCLEMDSLTCLLWNTKKITSAILVHKPYISIST
jgi:hypothetical protein